MTTRPKPEFVWTGMEDIKEEVDAVAQFPHLCATLIYGQTGTGKQRLAEYIASACEGGCKLFTLDCGALPPDRAEELLFGDGTERGLLETSNENILFIDEIASLTIRDQQRLLRVLQEKELVAVGSLSNPTPFTAIILGATNELPEVAIAQGKLRRDFYERIAGTLIHIPTLNERIEKDTLTIPKLSEEIFKVATRILKQNVTITLSHDALDYLTADVSYPGNVRQLENILLSSLRWSLQRNPSSSERVVIDMEALQQGGRATRSLLSPRVGKRNGAASLAQLKELEKRLELVPSRSDGELQACHEEIERLLEKARTSPLDVESGEGHWCMRTFPKDGVDLRSPVTMLVHAGVLRELWGEEDQEWKGADDYITYYHDVDRDAAAMIAAQASPSDN